MTTKPITYLPAPIVTVNPVRTQETNTLKVAACTIALGVLSYYAPRTFYAASAVLLGYTVLRFNQMTLQTKPSESEDVRNWTIKACTVMTSVGVVFGLRSLSCFWSSVQALRRSQILSTGSNLIAGLGMACIAPISYPFQNRAVELMRTKNWDQMADFLNFPIEVKTPPDTVAKVRHFLSAFFPKLFPLTGAPDRLYQFKSSDEKFKILKRYLPIVFKIPTDSVSQRWWTLGIHYFQGLSFWDQETLMPYLVRTGKGTIGEYYVASNNALPEQIENLPSPLNKRLWAAMQTYRTRFETPLNLDTCDKIPSVGTADWQAWVIAINEFLGLNSELQKRYMDNLIRIANASAPEQIDQLPSPLREQLKEAIKV